MPDLDRIVGGLRCRDVLELLVDYVDGELDAATTSKVETHLRGCDTCEKFGGDYRTLVALLRARLAEVDSGSEVRSRLDERMAREWAGDGG